MPLGGAHTGDGCAGWRCARAAFSVQAAARAHRHSAASAPWPTAPCQYIVFGRKYSVRSIERTLSSLTSTPCRTLSGISSPALPRFHTRV